MTYNHDEAKTLCPQAAAEVQRLRDLLALETSAPRLQAFDRGWIMAAAWTKRDDIVSDMDSAAYQIERAAQLRANPCSDAN